MFSIGEFARLGQVSVKMLRHYDRIGLLAPARVDPANGYRYYTAGQLPAIGRISALRDLGLGLAEIAAMAQTDPQSADAAASAAYQRRESQLRDAITAAEEQLRKLKASRVAIETGAATPVRVRSVPQQLVAISSGRDFGGLEREVAGYGVRADAPPLTLIGEQVLAAVPIRRSWLEAHGPATRLLPAVAEMACLRYQGSYAGLSAAWQALLAWVRDSGAEPGRELREVYLCFCAEPDLELRGDYLTSSADELVTELQVPVLPLNSARSVVP